MELHKPHPTCLWWFEKTWILALINSRDILHFNIGMTGILKRWHTLFKTNIHTLLSLLFRQRLYWLVVASRAHQYYQRTPNISSKHPIIYQLLLSHIYNSWLIPAPTTFDKTNPFITALGKDKRRSLFIKIDRDPLIYQDPVFDQKLEIIWIFS